MLKSAGRFFITRHPFLNDPSHFSVAFCISWAYPSVHRPDFPVLQYLARPHDPRPAVVQPALQCLLAAADQHRHGYHHDFVRQPVIQEQSPGFRSVSRYRTFAVRFYSPQFRCRIPCNKPHPFLLRQVNTAVRHDQSLFCRERPAQMVQVNAQVGLFVDQHAAGGVHRRIEILVRSDRTTVNGLVHVQGNLFHINVFLRIMSASHPKEQRELTLFRNRGTGIPDKQNR